MTFDPMFCTTIVFLRPDTSRSESHTISPASGTCDHMTATTLLIGFVSELVSERIGKAHPDTILDVACTESASITVKCEMRIPCAVRTLFWPIFRRSSNGHQPERHPSFLINHYCQSDKENYHEERNAEMHPIQPFVSSGLCISAHICSSSLTAGSKQISLDPLRTTTCLPQGTT